MLKVTAT